MRVRYSQKKVDRLKNNQEIVVDISSFTFNPKQKYYLEIGTGKGGFITQMALKYPHLVFIGIEKNPTILAMAMDKVKTLELKNVFLVYQDFYTIDPNLIKEKFEGIFLNFSDPWPKKRHAKRRLVSDTTIKLFNLILKPQGQIYFKTDNTELFNYGNEMFQTANYQIIDLTTDYQDRAIFDVETEYEKNFRQQGVKIKRGIYQKL